MYRTSSIKVSLAAIAAGLALLVAGLGTPRVGAVTPDRAPQAAAAVLKPVPPSPVPGEGEIMLAVPDCYSVHEVGPCVSWAGENGGTMWWLAIPLVGDPILLPECATEDGGTACVWPQPQVDTGLLPTYGGLL